MEEELKKILQKQHYKIVGEHSGVKLCHWMRQKLFYNRPCYKDFFYGIDTHKCLQLTPALNHCTQNCIYCWRHQKFTKTKLESYDEPEFILENSIKAQRLLLSGFKGDARCNLELWHEAQEPKHVAISLSGEPILYPRLGEFIELCTLRGMTTFLVSNGTFPEVIEKLTPLPTQLYVTVGAPNEEIYKKLCLPLLRDGWQRIKRTLAILPTLSTRKVIRHTLVDHWNLGWEEEYAKLDLIAQPDFIECKAYMFVGYSRQRMNLANMPSHDKIRKFAEKLASLTDYELAAEKKDSRVVLLAKDKSKMRISGDF